jgi:hypothetical protein
MTRLTQSSGTRQFAARVFRVKKAVKMAVEKAVKIFGTEELLNY